MVSFEVHLALCGAITALCPLLSLKGPLNEANFRSGKAPLSIEQLDQVINIGSFSVVGGAKGIFELSALEKGLVDFDFIYLRPSQNGEKLPVKLINPIINNFSLHLPVKRIGPFN